MNKPFIFDPSIDDVIAKTRALSDDLARILADGGPSAADLADAPILDRYVIIPRMRPSLAGFVAGHPILGDRVARTSEVFAIQSDDRDRGGWARTYSRFYRLGRAAGAARGRDQ